MQDFIKQAQKNGIELISKGNCQFCGADIDGGIFECMDIYNNKVLFSNYSMSNGNNTNFLMADTHALQHPEIHGRWNNHIHLIRMHVILNRSIEWNHKMTSILSNFFNKYKEKNPDEILIAPPILNRGKTTAREISSATSTIEYDELVNRWANEVFQAWNQHHQLISNIADHFIKGFEK